MKIAIVVFLLLGLWGCSAPARLDAPQSATATPKEITDCHVHVMSPAMIAMWKSMGIPFGKPDAAYSNIDSIISRLGTHRMKLVSMAYVYSSGEFSTGQGNIREMVRAENDYLALQKSKYPGSIEAYYGIDPMADFAMEEFIRCNDSLKLDGLKLHFNASQVYLTERKYQEKVKQVLEYAAAKKVPVLLHFDNSHRRFGLPDLEILSDSILAFIPKIHLQIAHLGTSGGFNSRTKAFIDAYLELIRDPAHPLHRHELVFDISAVALDKDSDGVPHLDEAAFAELAAYLRKIGMDKLVFGTDYPLYSSREYLDILRKKVKLSEEEITALLR
ncbi:MAG TPA: amidohydrolase family protein [Saprospiraceae bacterium]|nr:amidohydrolase family protein [Saprospiraceae bacterium]HRK80738.1 amidohydrolase family protein [Saprospiraceae bacterium]